MATSFTSLPVIDLAPLQNLDSKTVTPSPEILDLAKQLHDVFATSGFAYLANLPLSFQHKDVFGLSKDFFSLPEDEKMKLAKRTFVRSNENTYRGYFPIQPEGKDNLKEGFEIGSGKVKTTATSVRDGGPFSLYEPNVWPSNSTHFSAASRRRLTQLYSELQALSAQLLSLLALSLDKPADFFASWLDDSVSTLRLLHYPPITPQKGIDDDALSIASGSDISAMSASDSSSTHDSEPVYTKTPTIPALDDTPEVKLSCTPHTDSGILTLLHQDPTGGLEVLNSSGVWIPAPYIPRTLVVNIGDLMAKVSGGRWVATMHRVRAPTGAIGKDEGGGEMEGGQVEKGEGKVGGEWGGHGVGFGRFSVPFFFEPGEETLIHDIEGEGAVRYGDHVRAKMKTWVEFQGDQEEQA